MHRVGFDFSAFAREALQGKMGDLRAGGAAGEFPAGVSLLCCSGPTAPRGRLRQER